MMEPSDQHSDPLREATGRAAELAAHIGAVCGALAQVVLQHKALKEAEQAARDERIASFAAAQRSADHAAAEAAWAPARDPGWLANADVLDVAGAWGAAVPYAAGDREADEAMRACERRLGDLHPYAMSHYWRLRDAGASPVEAMTRAAPVFARPSPRPGSPENPRPGDPAPARPAIMQVGPEAARTAGESDVPGQAETSAGADSGASDLAAEVRRGLAIADRLEHAAAANGIEPPGPGGLRVALEALTNLTPDAVAAVVAAWMPSHLASAGHAPAVKGPAAASHPAAVTALDFPVPVSGAMPAMAARSSARTPGQGRTVSPARGSSQARPVNGRPLGA